jgi:hypothetical protein
MLKHYIKTTQALKNLRADTKGVVSFEYVLVAACIVSAVIFAFGITTSGNIAAKLSSSIVAILAKIVIT